MGAVSVTHCSSDERKGDLCRLPWTFSHARPTGACSEQTSGLPWSCPHSVKVFRSIMLTLEWTRFEKQAKELQAKELQK